MGHNPDLFQKILETIGQNQAVMDHLDDCPRITLSYAQSLDGCLSVRQGQPTALSGEASLKLTHQLRASHDSILVGVGTVLADNPHLTARNDIGSQPQPIILDTTLRTPLDARLWEHPKRPWFFCSEGADRSRIGAFERRGGLVSQIPVEPDGHLSLNAALHVLKAKGLESVMVEGGAGVIRSCLVADVVDWLVLTITPHLLGGYHVLNSLPFPAPHPGKPPLGFPLLREMQVSLLGEDLVVWGTLKRLEDDQR